jgi:hypothetical protein
LLPRSGSGFNGPPACFAGSLGIGWAGTTKTGKVFAEGSICLFSPFQRTSYWLTARARAFVSDQHFRFRYGQARSWQGKVVGPRPKDGGNDFFQQNGGAPTAGQGVTILWCQRSCGQRLRSENKYLCWQKRTSKRFIL